MLFNSYEFLLVFLPTAILIYTLADRHPCLRTWVLLALSLTFYSYWDVRFLPLMVGSILANWWAARLYTATKRHGIIVAAVAGNLLVLGIFKYTDFFAGTVAALLGMTFQPLALVLPLGISFFTFHHIMYLVDLGRGRAPSYPLDRYALYICFFPQAMAGPIARWNEVIDQFGQRVFGPGWERRCALGATFVVIGLAQKVLLADPLGRAIDPIFQTASMGPVTDGKSWVALGFAFQVFFDFSGYSDIAIGLALIFGVRLPINFDAPLRAVSLVELWQRWHMTLARFLRDYVFTPLSNLRIGGRRHRMTRLLAAVVITMALCGLWHGAGWTYVLWGTLQGLGLLFAVGWRRYLPSPPNIIGWAATFIFFVLTAVFFRADSLGTAFNIFSGLATLPDTLHPDGRNVFIAAFICAVVLPPSHAICQRLAETPSRLVSVSLAVAAVLALVVIGNRENYQFIYFQF
jgi:D-alanyl-lipoteichoic acid acyltransferase DltB (MBOAT superfamily)